MIFLRLVFIGLLLQLGFSGSSWSQSCQSIFLETQIRETKIQVSQNLPDVGSSGQSADFQPLANTTQLLNEMLHSINLKFLPAHSRFAVSLSRQNQIHFVSEGLSANQHQKLLTILQNKHLEKILASLPPLFRNRYFEVQFPLSVIPKIAWDLSFPVESQIETGFAKQATDKIRPYSPQLVSAHEKVRQDLLAPRTTQETLATCGLASIIKILRPRRINYSERNLLTLTEQSGIRGIHQIFGADPGLSLSQAAKLLQSLGHEHGFTVNEIKITSPEDEAEFAKHAAQAAQGRNIDVIVNYNSPVVGRPGGGHFTPIAGYNSKTKEVLLGEVNLAMNPAFWTHQSLLTQAMLAPLTADQPRGYLVITWSDSNK